MSSPQNDSKSSDATFAFDIVGLGMATYDILVRLENMPTWERTHRFDSIAVDGGGPAATAVATAARLGMKAGFAGIAGNDEIARMKLESLKSFSIDTSAVVTRDSPENQVVVCLVRQSDGERVFWGKDGFGANELSVGELDMEYFRKTRYLHLDGSHAQAAMAVAKVVRQAGGTVVLDSHQGSAKGVSSHLKALIPLCDVVIGSTRFFNTLLGIDETQKACKEALKLGPGIVVQTEGVGGSFTASRDTFFHTPSFSVPVIDTTGAGDVFHGAFIFGLWRGWDLKDTAIFATAVSAIVCTRLGGRRGIPTYSEVIEFLDKNSIVLTGAH